MDVFLDFEPELLIQQDRRIIGRDVQSDVFAHTSLEIKKHKLCSSKANFTRCSTLPDIAI